MSTIAFANQKGGVGKTTTCVNFAASLAKSGKKILMIDLDPQGNASSGVGLERDQLKFTAKDLLLGICEPREAILKTDFNFHVIGANADLTAAEVELTSGRSKTGLKNAIVHFPEFDYILIDCPPALNSLTVSALIAADLLIVPMQCEYYALEGLSALVKTVRQIQASVNQRLMIEGVVLTMVDQRSRLMQEIASEVKSYFGSKVYKSIIPRNIKLAEAPSLGKPAIVYDPSAKGSKAYNSVVQEFLSRHLVTITNNNDTIIEI